MFKIDVKIIYVFVVLTANILSGILIGYGNIVFDGGTLLFPLVFILRDYIHRKKGFEVSRNVVFNSFLVLSLFYASVFLTTLIGNVDVESANNLRQALFPGVRVVFASLTTLLLLELLDGFIYENVKGKTIKKIIVSNAFSIPLDTIIFTLLAFLGVFSILEIFSIIIINILLKFILTMIMIPFYKGK